MSIRFGKYISITSGIGAGINIPGRSLTGRLFTENPLVPTQSGIQFFSLEDVGTYFGTTSVEYAIASFYFTFVSKSLTRPQMISFYRWASADVEAQIFGSQAQSLSNLNLITNGSFTLTIGATEESIDTLDFSAAVSLAAVAAAIQTKINAASLDPNFASATVTFDPSSGGFNLTSGAVGDAVISVTAGTLGTDIYQTIGWGAQAIFSYGSFEETITDVLTESSNYSNNFGSFAFIPTLTLDQVTEAATWTAAQNVTYIYHVLVKTITDAQNYFIALKNFGGTCLTYGIIDGEYTEILPMAIFAATDFSRPNAVQNYMFQVGALTPSVNSDADSDLLDSYLTNYYGNTQNAGQNISFYQRGLMLGLPTDPSDINVYANEIWLKSAIGAAIMSLLLSVGRVPANDQGRAQIISTIQTVINIALLNGTISSDKPLTDLQKTKITEITNDERAYFQVGGIGYWLNCTMSPYVNPLTEKVEYKATYLLVYSKDDSIRFVESTHSLI
jgi:hypothetical protein